MFPVVGCTFLRFIASKSGIQNIHLSLQPSSYELPPLPARLKSKIRAIEIRANLS